MAVVVVVVLLLLLPVPNATKATDSAIVANTTGICYNTEGTYLESQYQDRRCMCMCSMCMSGRTCTQAGRQTDRSEAYQRCACLYEQDPGYK